MRRKMEERSKSRKKSYWAQLRNAKLGLFLDRTDRYFGKRITVRDLENDQLEIAIAYFNKRSKECNGELLRRKGEPKPDFGKAYGK
jgi:hypothetical protein